MIKYFHTHTCTDRNTSENDIVMSAGFLQPTTNYSLLHHHHHHGAINGETLMDAEDKHCTCTPGRSNGGIWLKKNLKVPEGYSKLSYNTA